MGKLFVVLGFALLAALLIGHYRMQPTDGIQERDSKSDQRELPPGVAHASRDSPAPRMGRPNRETKDSAHDISEQPPGPANALRMTEADWNLRASLLLERQGFLHDLKTDIILFNELSSIASYAGRAEAYCRYSEDHLNLWHPEGQSLSDLQDRYRKTLQEEPETAEGEQRKQMKLTVIAQRISEYVGDVETCKGLVINGFQRIKTNNEMQEGIAQTRARILKLDEQLASMGQ